MAKDIRAALLRMTEREARLAEMECAPGWEVVSRGFRKSYTEEEWARIERERTALRKRLFGPDE